MRIVPRDEDAPSCKRCKRQKSCLYGPSLYFDPDVHTDVSICYMYERVEEQIPANDRRFDTDS